MERMRRFVYYGASSAGATLLLDLYPAGQAFSLRKLKSSNSICLRVRRDLDNIEKDFGFIGGFVNVSAIESFVGAGNGFITNIYNQGYLGLVGYNAIQTSSSLQPKIVDSGVFNSELFVYGGYMEVENKEFSGSETRSIFSATKANTLSTAVGGNTIYSLTTFFSAGDALGTAFNVGLESADFRIRVQGNSAFNYAPPYNSLSPSVITNIYTGGGAQDTANFQNGDSMTFKTSVSALLNTKVGGWVINTSVFNKSIIKSGWTKEIILFNTDQTANRTAIETNINDYYGIY